MGGVDIIAIADADRPIGIEDEGAEPYPERIGLWMRTRSDGLVTSDPRLNIIGEGGAGQEQGNGTGGNERLDRHEEGLAVSVLGISAVAAAVVVVVAAVWAVFWLETAGAAAPGSAALLAKVDCTAWVTAVETAEGAAAITEAV